MELASRCLHLSVNPSTGVENAGISTFPVYGEDPDFLMAVNPDYELLISDKREISKFLDMFSISESEKTTTLAGFAEGDLVQFSRIAPSILVYSTESELIDLGIIEEYE